MPAISPAVLNICRDDDEGNLRECGKGIRVGGELNKDVKYADDQGMVANTEAGLQNLMDRLNTTAKHYDMKINIKKTKAMVFSRNVRERVNITVEGQSVEQVSKFKYLGSLVSEDGGCLDKVKCQDGSWNGKGCIQ